MTHSDKTIIFLEIDTQVARTPKGSSRGFRYAKDFTSIENCRTLMEITPPHNIPELTKGDRFYFEDLKKIVEILQIIPTSNGNVCYVIKDNKVHGGELEDYLAFLDHEYQDEKDQLCSRLEELREEYNQLYETLQKLRNKKIFGIRVNRI